MSYFVLRHASCIGYIFPPAPIQDHSHCLEAQAQASLSTVRHMGKTIYLSCDGRGCFQGSWWCKADKWACYSVREPWLGG